MEKIPAWDTAILAGLLLLALLIILLLAAVLLLQHIFRRKEKEELECQKRLLEVNYNNLSEWYGERDRLYHDFKNHVLVLSELLRQQEWEKALSYAEGIEKPVKRIEGLIRSGNRTVDMILNEKTGKAALLGVELTVDCGVLKGRTLSDMDWCTILGNLLDNALEACALRGEKGWIRLEIQWKRKILLIQLFNNYAKAPVVQEGKLQTGKDGSGESRKRDADNALSHGTGSVKTQFHGIGMKSVESAVRKNGGIMEWEYDENLFAVHITLFC